MKWERTEQPACFQGRFLTKKYRFRNTVWTPCRVSTACSPCSDGKLSYCPQRHPPCTSGVAGWRYLCGYTAGLHCSVHSRIAHADHEDALPLKHVGMLVLLAVKVLALKPLDALGKKKQSFQLVEHLWVFFVGRTDIETIQISRARKCKLWSPATRGGPGLHPAHTELVLPLQNHRITECWGLEGTSVGHPVQHPAEAGSPTAGCKGPCPGGS